MVVVNTAKIKNRDCFIFPCVCFLFKSRFFDIFQLCSSKKFAFLIFFFPFWRTPQVALASLFSSDTRLYVWSNTYNMCKLMKDVIWWSLDGTSDQRKPDLIAVILGGAEVIRGQNENITLNASLSYDPVVGLGNHSGMNFTWHYGEIKGNYSGLQTTVRDSFIGINQSNVHYIWNDSGLEVTFNTASSMFQDLTTLLVKLVVTKDYRSSSAHQIIHLVQEDPPQISQRYKSCFIVYQSNHWPSKNWSM